MLTKYQHSYINGMKLCTNFLMGYEHFSTKLEGLQNIKWGEIFGNFINSNHPSTQRYEWLANVQNTHCMIIWYHSLELARKVLVKCEQSAGLMLMVNQIRTVAKVVHKHYRCLLAWLLAIRMYEPLLPITLKSHFLSISNW